MSSSIQVDFIHVLRLANFIVDVSAKQGEDSIFPFVVFRM